MNQYLIDWIGGNIKFVYHHVNNRTSRLKSLTKEDKEDIVSRVLLKLATAAETIEKVDNYEGLAQQTITFELLSFLRVKSRKPTITGYDLEVEINEWAKLDDQLTAELLSIKEPTIKNFLNGGNYPPPRVIKRIKNGR